MSLLFGSSSSLPAIDNRPFGLQQQRANTNQQARPVPLLYGQQRISVTFLSDVFDPLSAQVSQSVGKQSTTVGNNYYASFAALLCMGPVDGLYDIFLNGEPVFNSQSKLFSVSLTASGSTGQLFYTATFQTANPHGLATGNIVTVFQADQPAFNGEFTITVVSPTQFQYQIVPVDVTHATDNQYGSIYCQVRLNPVLRDPVNNPDFATITIPDYGSLTIYWGTETQPASSYLNTKSGNLHPPYLGQCYVVFHQLFFGFNQTNVPNIEFIIAVHPLPDWASLSSGAIGTDANPAYVIGDLLQNPRSGLELPDGLLDTDALDAAAVQYANTESLGISSPLDRAQDLRTVLTTICETIDALPVLDVDYLLSLLPIRPPADPSKLPVVRDCDLADLPSFAPQDWSTTYTDTKVIFSDAALEFMDNLAEWRDIGVKNITANPDTLQLDRKWITQATIAQAIANATGQAAAIPLLQGRIKVRYKDTLWAALSPGNMFLINTSLRSTANLTFRVLSREMKSPETPEFDIEFQADRTYLYAELITTMGAGTGGGATPEIGYYPTVPALSPIPVNTRLMVFELPCGLCPCSPALACIVARSSSITTSFSIWLNKNYAWSGTAPDSYTLLQSPTVFAFHGMTTSEYPATTQNIDLLLGVTVQLDGPDLILEPITAFEALADTMLAFVDDEIMSLAAWALLGTGLYQLQFIRGRFGTPIQDHASGAQIMLVSRAGLAVISQPEFQPGNTAQIKLTLDSGNVGDANEIDVPLAGLAWQVPPPAGLLVNGNNINATFPGGSTPVAIAWQLPDPGGILPRFDLAKLSTRLQFVVAGVVVYQTDIAWPAKSASLNFAALTGLADQNFVLTAQTICCIGWQQIASFAPATLNVTKYP